MPTLTGSGSFSLPALQLSGVGEILSPDAGPNTRQSSVNYDITFKGDYFDELDGVRNDKVAWKADGFKFSDRSGTGEGQSNRLWFDRSLRIGYGQILDLDLYSFLTVNAGKGFGQDSLGLGIVMNEITGLIIRNPQGGSDLEVGGAAISPWEPLFSGKITIRPGERIIAQTRNATAWAVTQGSSQYLRLAPTGNPCTVGIFVTGRFTSIS